MKKISRYLLMFLLFEPCLVFADTTIPMPEIRKINDHVYALLGPVGLPDKNNNGYMNNSTVIIGEKGVILIDTGFTDEIGQHIKKVIRGITDKPVTHIINTHHHGDHSLGNSAFMDVEIISAEKCREWLKKTGYTWLESVESMTGRTFPNTKPVLASKVYPEDSKTTVTLQGISMTLWVPKGSHTPGDMMVHLPADNILITGDIAVNTMIPSLRDANVKTLVKTLTEISHMNVATIIPGHGNLMKTGDISKLHNLIASFYNKVEAGYKKGLIDSDIRKTLDLTEWKKYINFNELMGTNINHTYLEVEEANF